MEGLQTLLASIRNDNDVAGGLWSQLKDAHQQFYHDSMLRPHDDIDVTVGTNKLKFKGGHGGHNGLRDIINHKNDSFWRLRIGVGHPGEKSLVHNYVLSAPTNSEKEIILNSFEDIHNNFALILKNKFEDFMNILHRKKDGV